MYNYNSTFSKYDFMLAISKGNYWLYLGETILLTTEIDLIHILFLFYDSLCMVISRDNYISAKKIIFHFLTGMINFI